MKPTLTPARTPAEVQIDSIANALPESVRADFYREMKYCSSLSQSDEMLHILNILQILTVVMVDVPTRIAAERDQIEENLKATRVQLRENLAVSQAYQKQIENRLTQLPQEIAKGISPSTIASSINESLRQQFVATTIPETAKALSAMSIKLREITAEFGTNARSLSDTYNGAASDARKAITELYESISAAAKRAREATDQLSVTYDHAYRWSFHVLTGGGAVVGMLLIIALIRLFFS
jgi:hypothetical protein